MVLEERSVNDYNTIELPQVDNSEARQKLIDRLYSRPAPKPTFDTTAPEYMKRAAKYNAIGKGLSALGSAFSMGRGGNINRPQQDNKIHGYLNNYFRYLDDYRNRMDAYEMMNFQNQQRADQMMLGELNRQDDQNYRRGVDQRNFAYQQGRDKVQSEQWKAGFDESKRRADIDDKRQQEAFEYQKKVPYIQAGIQEKQLEKRLASDMMKYQMKMQYDDANKKFTLYDDSRNPVARLDPGEMEKIVQLIIKDPAVSEKAAADIALMKATFGEGLSKQAIQTIIAYYWQQSPLAKEYLGVNKTQKQPGNPFTPRPEYPGGPLRTGQAPSNPVTSTGNSPAPQDTTKQPEYSTGGYY